MTLLAATLAAQIAFLATVTDGGTAWLGGAPQTGKSRALKAADERPKPTAAPRALKRRRVVFDPYAHRDRMLFDRGLKKSPPWGGRWCSANDLIVCAEELLDHDDARIVVAPKTLDKAELGRQFSLVVDTCWATGDVDVVAEEAGLYGRWCLDAMMQLSSGGSHALMRLFVVSQSLGRLPLDARRHISHVVAFAQGETSDLDDLRKRCGRSFAERVAALNPSSGLAELWKLGDLEPKRS